MTQTGSPGPRNDRTALRRHTLANWWCADLPAAYAASNSAGRQGDPAVCIIRNDLKQLTGPIAALGRYDAQFGKMPADGVAQHGSLTHQ